jgi:hypothetical protein
METSTPALMVEMPDVVTLQIHRQIQRGIGEEVLSALQAVSH